MASATRFLIFSLLLVAVFSCCRAATPQQWQSRTIYQLLTDRFAQSGSNPPPCNDLSNYCGGTFQGIQNHLDYIQSMGFDAIWISPIPVNTPGGYHGYWLKDLYRINPHFGSSSDLKNLVQAAHQRGMYVMLDLVQNHVGPGIPLSQYNPFNQSEHYHSCNNCPDGCQINDYTCFQYEVEHCRLAGLPDLNQTVPFVKKALISAAVNTIKTFGFDGLRIDTVPEIVPTYWADFQAAVNIYAVGEVFSDLSCCVAYQNVLDGVLSYPLFFTMRNVFQQKQSMYQLQGIMQAYLSEFKNVNLLGTFIDNHDNARFLDGTSDYQLYKNAICFTLMSVGIPIIYYGTEQGFNGGNDPDNREALWPTGYATTNPLYQFITTVVNYRKKAQVWNYPQVQRYADDSFYAFTRGTTFVATTNAGSNSGGTQRTITYHPYANGQKLCNLFYPTTDCFVVQNGQFVVYLLNGECKIYYPVASEEITVN